MVTILTKDLHRYMTLANMVLVQQLDVDALSIRLLRLGRGGRNGVSDAQSFL